MDKVFVLCCFAFIVPNFIVCRPENVEENDVVGTTTISLSLNNTENSGYNSNGPCAVNLCKNNGTCIEDSSRENGYSCICVEGTEGINCDKVIHGEVTICINKPCLNGGTCQLDDFDPRGFTCICEDNYNGLLCENGQDPCSSHECQKGGTCNLDDFEDRGYSCICAEGFFGINCENENQCENSICNNGGTCQVIAGDVKCNCPAQFTGEFCDDELFDRTSCSSHPCQNGGTCILDNREDKMFVCLCGNGFFGPMCEKRNDCGKHCKSCNMTDSGKKMCSCDPGYAYDEDLNSCEYCMSSCDENAINCAWLSNRKPSCICKSGYAYSSYSKLCFECDCGSYGSCNYQFFKECNCKEGYKEKNGTCEECNCGPGSSCNFGSNGQRYCTCQDGFYQKGGRCENCNCGELSSCELVNGRKLCLCRLGQEDKGGYCGDIDACQNSNACPRTTHCVTNPNGGYSCLCEEGYEKKFPESDPRVDGCKDIDECKSKNACPGRGTQCINLEGSYACVCREGFRPTQVSTDPKNNLCEREPSGLITAIIVCGALGGAALLALIIAMIINLRRSKR